MLTSRHLEWIECIQHHPMAGDDKQASIEYFTDLAEQYPGKTMELARVVADGGFVCTAHASNMARGEDYATLGFFRFDANGRMRGASGCYSDIARGNQERECDVLIDRLGGDWIFLIHVVNKGYLSITHSTSFFFESAST